MKCKAILFFCLVVAGYALQSQTGLEIDIQHTRLDLEINKKNKSLQAEARIRFRSVERIDSFTLFLQGLQVDSANMAFRHQNDSILTFYLPATLEAGATDSLYIRYHGHPVMDASGWGGFYFQGDFAFNLGVGFAADPHPFGRVWFPCKDDFNDRCTFDFYITSDKNDMALCNGLLTDSSNTAAGKTVWHWQMNDPIVSYLASVAIAPYRPAVQNYQGKTRNFPVWYGGRAGDTAKMKKSFVHLFDAIRVFENAYGPQAFEKVGYALVPFSGGAMEHAGNIAFPLSAANGSTRFESLMVHELSHHWWGDWVTCANAGEMWLNEGWASWSEFLFLEKVYGRKAYEEALLANRRKILLSAHKDDRGYRAIRGTPHDYTYGTHVYDKGADVIHTLRGYMGDEAFFRCIKEYLAARAWGNMESIDFRDFLSDCSGMDMEAFFDSYVFLPGYTRFTIDSSWIIPEGGYYNCDLWIRQRLHHAPSYYDEVPLEITFFGAQGQRKSISANLSGPCSALSLRLSYEPKLIVLNLKERISTAGFQELIRLKDNANALQSRADIKFNRIEFNADSILIFIAHHLVRPDREGVPEGIVLSESHYWQLDGIFPESTLINGEVPYDGNDKNSPYDLDKKLISKSEDSLVVLYRPGAGEPWHIWKDVNLITLGKGDKSGTIGIQGMKKGEYVLGIRDAGRIDTFQSDIPATCEEIYLGMKSTMMSPPVKLLSVTPNPGVDTIIMELDPRADLLLISRTDGSKMLERKLKNESGLSLDIKNWGRGTYVFSTFRHGEKTGTGKFIIP